MKLTSVTYERESYSNDKLRLNNTHYLEATKPFFAFDSIKSKLLVAPYSNNCGGGHGEGRWVEWKFKFIDISGDEPKEVKVENGTTLYIEVFETQNEPN